VNISASLLVFLKCGGLEDKRALNEQEHGGGVQQWVVGEEDKVGLKHRRPNESSQYEYPRLRQYCCGEVSTKSSKKLGTEPEQPRNKGGRSLPVPVKKLNCSPWPGLCVTSPGRPRRGSSSCKAGFSSGTPVAEAICKCRALLKLQEPVLLEKRVKVSQAGKRCSLVIDRIIASDCAIEGV